jgi:hypothetical protein
VRLRLQRRVQRGRTSLPLLLPVREPRLSLAAATLGDPLLTPGGSALPTKPTAQQSPLPRPAAPRHAFLIHLVIKPLIQLIHATTDQRHSPRWGHLFRVHSARHAPLAHPVQPRCKTLKLSGSTVVHCGKAIQPRLPASPRLPPPAPSTMLPRKAVAIVKREPAAALVLDGVDGTHER